jgi:microcystin-dependent protein
MSNQFIGEIRMFGGNFAPQGWAFCDGQTLSITQNTALFSLIGTFYGGNGTTTFQLPNLQGRVPVHMGSLLGGSSYILATPGGEENVTLTTAQMPAHSHQFVSSNVAGLDNPAGSVLGAPAAGTELYASSGPTGNMNPSGNLPVGSNQPHPNLMPYLATNFIIALFGIYPSRN